MKFTIEELKLNKHKGNEENINSILGIYDKFQKLSTEKKLVCSECESNNIFMEVKGYRRNGDKIDFYEDYLICKSCGTVVYKFD